MHMAMDNHPAIAFSVSGGGVKFAGFGSKPLNQRIHQVSQRQQSRC